jgi:hypothetical protein
MKKEINIIRSETWLTDDFKMVSDTLKETIDDFVDDDEKIINIQLVKSDDGLSRFWIYIENIPQPIKR